MRIVTTLYVYSGTLSLSADASTMNDISHHGGVLPGSLDITQVAIENIHWNGAGSDDTLYMSAGGIGIETQLAVDPYAVNGTLYLSLSCPGIYFEPFILEIQPQESLSPTFIMAADDDVSAGHYNVSVKIELDMDGQDGEHYNNNEIPQDLFLLQLKVDLIQIQYAVLSFPLSLAAGKDSDPSSLTFFSPDSSDNNYNPS